MLHIYKMAQVNRSESSLAGRSLVQCRYRKQTLIDNGKWADMTAKQRVCRSGRTAGQGVKAAVRPPNGQAVEGQVSTARNRRWRNRNRARLVRPTDDNGTELPYFGGKAEFPPARYNPREERNEPRRNQARQAIDPHDELGYLTGYYDDDVFVASEMDTDINNPHNQDQIQDQMDYGDGDDDGDDDVFQDQDLAPDVGQQQVIAPTPVQNNPGLENVVLNQVQGVVPEPTLHNRLRDNVLQSEAAVRQSRQPRPRPYPFAIRQSRQPQVDPFALPEGSALPVAAHDFFNNRGGGPVVGPVNRAAPPVPPPQALTVRQRNAIARRAEVQRRIASNDIRRSPRILNRAAPPVPPPVPPTAREVRRTGRQTNAIARRAEVQRRLAGNDLRRSARTAQTILNRAGRPPAPASARERYGEYVSDETTLREIKKAQRDARR
jgi:hypothetical protein